MHGNFPSQLRKRSTGQWYDLVVEVTCPKCGFDLLDPKELDRLPLPGSWYSVATATCSYCGHRYQVRMIEENKG